MLELKSLGRSRNGGGGHFWAGVLWGAGDTPRVQMQRNLIEHGVLRSWE